MGRRLAILAADEVVVDADAPDIPVGIDGETVMMATPVHCAIRPQAAGPGIWRPWSQPSRLGHQNHIHGP